MAKEVVKCYLCNVESSAMSKTLIKRGWLYWLDLTSLKRDFMQICPVCAKRIGESYREWKEEYKHG